MGEQLQFHRLSGLRGHRAIGALARHKFGAAIMLHGRDTSNLP